MKNNSTDKMNCEDCKYYMGHKHYTRINQSNGMIYGLGFIGAVIYFISQATTFWIGVLGFLKAIVWPAFLVYEALKFLMK